MCIVYAYWKHTQDLEHCSLEVALPRAAEKSIRRPPNTLSVLIRRHLAVCPPSVRSVLIWQRLAVCPSSVRSVLIRRRLAVCPSVRRPDTLSVLIRRCLAVCPSVGSVLIRWCLAVWSVLILWRLAACPSVRRPDTLSVLIWRRSAVCRWRRGMMDGWGLDLMCALQCSSGCEIWLVPRGLLLRRDSSVGEGSRGLGFGLAKGAWKCAVSREAWEKARKYREVCYSLETRKQGFLTRG